MLRVDRGQRVSLWRHALLANLAGTLRAGQSPGSFRSRGRRHEQGPVLAEKHRNGGHGERTPRSRDRRELIMRRKHPSSPPAAGKTAALVVEVASFLTANYGGGPRTRNADRTTDRTGASLAPVGVDRPYQMQLTATSNTYAEHRVRTVRSECLDWTLIWDDRQLCQVLTEYPDHYGTATYPQDDAGRIGAALPRLDLVPGHLDRRRPGRAAGIASAWSWRAVR